MARQKLPTANRGPGRKPPEESVTVTGLAAKAAAVVGSSGQASNIVAKSVTINQADTVSNALTITSAGSGYAGNLLDLKNSSGTSVTTVGSSGRLNLSDYTTLTEQSAPSTPSANTLRVYAKDSGGVSTLFYKDDGGTEHDLSGTAGSSSPGAYTILVAASDATTAEKLAAGATYTCDGTADDVQIQAAITAINALTRTDATASDRGTVQLSSGTFFIDDPISLTDRIGIRGQGSNATWLEVASTWTAGDYMIVLNSVNEEMAHISGLALRGLVNTEDAGGIYLNNTGASGLEFSDPAHVLDDIYIYGCVQDGVKTSANCRAVKMTRVRVVAAKGYGFNLAGPDSFYVACESGMATGGGAGSHGFNITGNNGMYIGCKSWYSGGDGWHDGGQANQFVGCQAQDNDDAGFAFAGGRATSAGLLADSNGRDAGSSTRYGYYISGARNTVHGSSYNYNGTQQYAVGWSGTLANTVDSKVDVSCNDSAAGAMTGTPGSGSQVFINGEDGTREVHIYDHNIVTADAALATNAANGFLYIPSCAGTPTGTPTTYTGTVPLVVDTTNHKLYFYDGSWRDAGP